MPGPARDPIEIRSSFVAGRVTSRQKKRGGPEHGIRPSCYADLASTDQVERHCYAGHLGISES
jgi:hypothetical protein